MAFCSPSPLSRSSTSMGSRLLTTRVMQQVPTIADHEISNHLARSNSILKSQNYFDKTTNNVFTRFSKNDWESSNKAHFSLSDKERSFAERLRGESWQTIKTIDQQTKNRQANNTKKLGERVQDIHFWKEELQNEIHANSQEMDCLKEMMQALEQAIADTNLPLKTTEECMLNREKRVGIDRVSDAVEKALEKEADIIKTCKDRMKKILEKSEAQQKMTRSAQHACDQDLRNKCHAHTLDDRMQQLHNNSSHIGLHPNIENVDNTISVPVTWAKFTQDNINRSQKEREASAKLRGDIDGLIRACNNEMTSATNKTNSSFNTRVQELNDAKVKLQTHLIKTCSEAKEMERSIGLLRKAIHDKEAPLKVAQTRLEERTRRIDVEICNDPSMQGLQKEVEEIKEAIRALKAKLKDCDSALCRLLKTRSALENDIATKDRSLDIDVKSCMNMRKGVASNTRLPAIIQNL